MEVELNLKVVGIRRRGQWLLAFIRERGCVIVSTAPALWTARRRFEQGVGGAPWPDKFKHDHERA
jgi:hypothetical protein